MKIYRIVKKAYADLDGIGGVFAAGRWHSKGKRVVYAAESISLAAWEKLIHLTSLSNLPNDLQVMEISIPDSIPIKIIETQHLSQHWADFPYDEQAQKMGDAFLQDSKQLILRVPSAIMPSENNFLINPNCEFVSALSYNLRPFAFDERLSKL